MKPYKSSDTHIAREMAKVAAENLQCGRSDAASVDALQRKRLELDIADILTGPTCGSEAQRLSFLILQGDPESVAVALVEAGKRYLDSLEK